MGWLAWGLETAHRPVITGVRSFLTSRYLRRVTGLRRSGLRVGSVLLKSNVLLHAALVPMGPFSSISLAAYNITANILADSWWIDSYIQDNKYFIAGSFALTVSWRMDLMLHMHQRRTKSSFHGCISGGPILGGMRLTWTRLIVSKSSVRLF